VRTVHRLTHAVTTRGTLELRVRLGRLTPDDMGPGWGGVLVGVGGEHVDYRLSALTHHQPGEDGGLLAVIDERGHVTLRDFSRDSGSRAQWSVRGPVDPARVPELADLTRTGPGYGAGGPRPVDLHLSADVDPGGCRITLTATEADGDTLISRVEAADIEPRFLDGNVALVSHGGGGHWFGPVACAGSALRGHPERRFGPVLFTLYTTSAGTLSLTAQLAPLGRDDPSEVHLDFGAASGGWRRIATTRRHELSHTATFRVDSPRSDGPTPFRVMLEGDATGYQGVLQAEPPGDRPLTVAALTCQKVYTGGLRWNHDAIWFPHAEIVTAVAHHDPDLLYFSGDQIYEGDLTPAVRRPESDAILDYLYKWTRWGWSFGSLTRRLPTVCIPDDHDVYHGNLWGAGGRAARAEPGLTAQDSGGYVMPPAFVNVVHRTQTSHLPAPVDPAPIAQGISVYFTQMTYGGVSFAILGDRMFKSSASVMVPAGQVVNGWFQNADFDPATDADVVGAELLGPRQERFLDHWASDWSGGVWMKVALSQTLFTNLATIPAAAKSGSVLGSLPAPQPDVYPRPMKLAADTDSNGWPRSARDRAVRALRRALAFHISGDQHLGAVVQYGLDDHRDGPFAFSTPAIANTWPRRWFPPAPGDRRAPGAPEYTGDFRDGFGNRMTVVAVANPVKTGRHPTRLYDRVPGYGIVRLDPATRTVTLECWPRWVDPADRDARQFAGWPITIPQTAADGRVAVGLLPRIHVTDMEDPVVQVVHEPTGEILYTLRVAGRSFAAWVYEDAPHTVRIGEPGTARLRSISGLRPRLPSRDR
ncbi:MAG: hypothetical protein HKO59_10610, partial [Phycisphaerales bacterium]|nr:hypothetical protein [Phycisphaerales bacterium]